MQIKTFGYRVKGLYRLASLAFKDGSMDKIALQRFKIISFYLKHGLVPTLDAFDVKRRTLFNWLRAWREQGGNKAALAPRSKAPLAIRKNSWDPSIVSEIKRLRFEFPNMCKDKLFAMLIPFCQTKNLPIPSVSTIGRIVKSDPSMTTPPFKKRTKRDKNVIRKPKNINLKPLETLAMDTIVRLHDGVRRYVHTCIDPATGVAFAYASSSNSSLASSRLLASIWEQFPCYQTSKILTDNGSEFKLHFKKMLSEKQITHWHTYPKTPKMNAHCERFNQTIQTGFVDIEEDLLISDLAQFNDRLAEWLVQYNTVIPHLSTKPHPHKTTTINNFPVPPVKYLLSKVPKCNMYWTTTIGLIHHYLS